MSSQQKRGFRLPWAAERSAEDGAAAATLEAEPAEPTTPVDSEDGVGGDLGEGPFHFADVATPEASTDASPEAPEVPETTAEAAMIDTETPTTEPSDTAPPATDQDMWPAIDQRQAAASEGTPDETAQEQVQAEHVAPEPAVAPPPVHVEGDVRTTRANPLVAGLVKAMREATLASREETTNRLTGDATARVELIREAGTSQAADLRKRADDDISGIREWSKTEIARIKQEADERIERRRTELTAQTERHDANVQHQVELVQSTVAAFEADMDGFFERLLAENDPAKLAALAEQAPEPPDLAADLPSFEEDATAPAGAAWDGVAWGTTGLGADDAAEAEAAATEGLDLPGGDEWPTSVLASARRSAAQAAGFEAAGVANTRLHVNGLASVAGISAFKGALGQLPGVRTVSVSSGEPGVFIFTVVHSPEADMQDGIASLTSFSARVTDASGDTLTVVAHEPAA
jgi:hypothetical protein